MRKRHYIFTGIIAYFIFLLTTIPAAPVINLFKNSLPVTISNVSGTLWNGQAGTVRTQQNLTLKNIEWSFLPWRLLLFNVAFDVNAEYNNKPLSSRLSTGISRNLYVDNLNMKLDATDIAAIVSLPLGELSGEFHVRVNNAVLAQGAVPVIDGTLNWNQASVTIAETADLGNVSILINEKDDSPLAASISNKGGHLSLEGKLTTTIQGDYSLQLTMKPNTSASDNLVSSIAMFARKQRDGNFILNNSGNLKQLGLM